MGASPRYSKGAGCAGCSLETAGWGFALASGPAHARLLLIGESLGAEEAIAGEPFYGSAGGVLSRILVRAGINRDHVRIHNVVNCRPPNDYLVGAPWEDHAISYCRQYLQPTIDQLPTDGVIVPLGATALGAILNLSSAPGVAVKDFAGTVSRSPDDRHWVVPTFHPSHLQRGAMNLLDVVTEDIKLADKISRSGFVRSRVELMVDPTLEWFQAWVTAHLDRVTADPDGTWCAIDTEFEGKPEDESEAHVTGGVRLTRFNCAHDETTGITVPYAGEFIREVERLLVGLARLRGIALLWFKYADWVPLKAAGHTLEGIEAYDLAALWHHIQSDLPQGLGFVAARSSDFGPWKHWSKHPELFGRYAAADGVQTYRCGVWLIRAAQQLGMWELFVRDWHERDQYCLRPAHDQGVPIDRVELDQFHRENQEKLGRILERFKATAAAGVLKPKAGYAKRPKGAVCPGCSGDGMVGGDPCFTCNGAATLDPKPPKSILGKPTQGGAEAKSQYMLEGVRLVEKQIEIEVAVCATCNATFVTKNHRCKGATPRRPRRKPDAGAIEPDRYDTREVGSGTHDLARVAAAQDSARTSTEPLDDRQPGAATSTRLERRIVTRWFWQLPFNPDAPAQILAYIAQQGVAQPFDRKKQKATTNKQAMKKLAKEQIDDPFYQLSLDWKAVQKVDSTYAVGTQRLLDQDNRVHPEFLSKPSTLRDSCQTPNIQNCAADKTGPESLAAGFRRCMVSRDGVPPGVTELELLNWSAKWAS